MRRWWTGVANARPRAIKLGRDGLALAGGVFDGHAHDRAVLGPAAVVVLDVVEAEQLLEHEPRVRRTLADAAVGDHVLIGRDALVAVQLTQVFGRLERAILVGRLGPRDTLGTRHVPRALGGLGHAWRGDDFAVELGW